MENQIRKSNSQIYYFAEVPEKVKEAILRECKILIHFSEGKLRDYFEYSILDAMLYGVVPICFTPDKEQFKIIQKKKRI